MAGGVKISIIPDVSKVLAATDDVGEAFAEVADSLDDMAREAQKAGKATADGIDKGTDSAADSVDDLGKSFRDLTRDVSKSTKKIGDDLGDDVKRGAREASEGTDTLKDNAGANAKEIAASFDGSADSIADGFQGLAAEALEGFGPLGLAAGVALAAGAGIFKSQWEQSAEDTKEIMGDMWDDLLDSESGYLTESYQQQSYYDILKGESRLLALADLDRIAKASKTTNEQVAAAYAGNLEEMQRVTDGLVAHRAVFQAQLEDETTTNDSAAQSGIKYIDGMIGKGEQRVAQIEDTIDATKRAETAWAQYSDTASSAADQAKGRLDAVGAALDRVSGTRSVSVDVDLSPAERSLRNWRPVVTVEGQFVAGRAVK